MEILCERIIKYLRTNDYLENIYADDFILILYGNIDQCKLKLKRIENELKKPISIDISDSIIRLDYRIAVICYPYDFQDIEIAVNYLILFAKYIKNQNLIGTYYLDKMTFPIFNKLIKFTDFISSKDFSKYIVPSLQGIWDLNTNKLFGYEVLSRILYEGKTYNASQFIDVLEYFKMNLKSDEIIINKALQHKLETKDSHVYFF